MSKTIIKVEGLGKKYMLGHQTKEKYTSLRDVITSNVKNAFRHTKDLISGGHAIEGDTEEEFWALRDLNFEINKGDRVGIIGRNGAGKSTLLKVLSRITEPTTGKVTINGRVASLLEVGTGFHPELSGRENIFLNGAILGMSRREIRSKFDEIVAFAEVEKFLDTPVKRYSSGMYVRLAFAVAAHLEPEILIVDEVLAVGDAQFQKKCLGKMEDVSRNEGRTVLFVSHNMGVISQLCEKSIFLKGGMVHSYGLTNKVMNDYLGNRLEQNEYFHQGSASQSMYIKSAKTINENFENCSEFTFNSSVGLYFEAVINELDSTSKLSITIQNTNGDYLTTIVEDISTWYSKSNNLVSKKVFFEPNLISPNTYSFRLAIFNSKGHVYDIVEMICPFQIFDNGTNMALFEGINYGCFNIKYKTLS